MPPSSATPTSSLWSDHRRQLSPTRERLLLALVVLMTVVVVGLGAVSFARKVSSFQSTGLELARQGGAWVVTAASEDSELRAGDVIELVNSEAPADRAAIEESLRKRSVSELFVLRDGQLLPNVRHPLPPLDIDFPYLLLALIGVLYLLIGLFTLRRGLSFQTFLFQIWCLTSAAIYLFASLPPHDVLNRTIYVVEEVCRLILPPLTLHFFLVFPRRIQVPERWRATARRAIPFLYLPSCALMAYQLDMILTAGRLFAGAPTPSRIVLLDRLELYLLIGFALCSVAALLTHLRQSDHWEHGRQVLWVTLGMAAGYLPFLALYAAPFSFGFNVPEGVEVAAVLPLALVPISFAYAILRYRLWDITVIVRDITTYTLTLLLAALGFSLLQLLIRRSIPEDFDLARNLATITGGLVIAGLLVPTKQGIGSTLQRFHYRGSFGRRRALSQFGQELLHERDLSQLSQGLLQELEEAMDLERCNLFLVEDERLAPVRPEPLPNGEDSLPLASFEPGLWRRDWVHLSGIGAPDVRISAEQALFIQGYRSTFPLTVRGRKIGLVVAGLKAAQIPLNSDDCMLIRQLLNQASLAIENAQLLEQMQRQLQEVVELKKFNEEIIESSPAGIVVLDEGRRIVSANLAFAALVGFERSALKRRPIDEVLSLEQLPRPREGIVEATIFDRTGRQRELQLSLASFVGDRTMAVQVLVVNDITELAEMERALEEKERLAALGVVAAGVAHEVNTPLTGISSYAQMLLEKTSHSDPRYELLTKLERQTFRAARIVNTLLELSRASRQDAPRPVPIVNLLTEVLELLAERITAERIEVVRPEVAAEAKVSGNESELQQVFTNLISNAIDAMKDCSGSKSLRLELRQDEREVEVCVCDTGPGIDSEVLGQIFRPFFTTKTDRGGTGLGLSISYEIVRRHGGELLAANGPEGGGRFSVRLPRFPFGPNSKGTDRRSGEIPTNVAASSASTEVG